MEKISLFVGFKTEYIDLLQTRYWMMISIVITDQDQTEFGWVLEGPKGLDLLIELVLGEETSGDVGDVSVVLGEENP